MSRTRGCANGIDEALGIDDLGEIELQVWLSWYNIHRPIGVSRKAQILSIMFLIEEEEHFWAFSLSRTWLLLEAFAIDTHMMRHMLALYLGAPKFEGFGFLSSESLGPRFRVHFFECVLIGNVPHALISQPLEKVRKCTDKIRESLPLLMLVLAPPFGILTWTYFLGNALDIP